MPTTPAADPHPANSTNPADPAATVGRPSGARPAGRSDAPSLGERYDPFGAHLADPYSFYAHARTHQPVLYSPALGAWVLTRHADIRYALAHPELFSSANALRPLTRLHPATLAVLRDYPRTTEPITADGRAHRRLRAPIAKALSTARITALLPRLRTMAHRLIDAITGHDQHTADLLAAYANPLPQQVICDLFGINPADRGAMVAGSYASVRLVAGAAAGKAQQANDAASMLNMQRRLGRYAHHHRTHTPNTDDHSDHSGDGGDGGLLGMVVDALAPGQAPLTPAREAEIAHVLHGVFIAGHVTTTAVIGTGLYHLLRHPEQWQLLCRHPELLPGAVEEILRYDPPVQGFLRVTTRPVVLSGVELPAGAEVFLAYGAANRDPAVFADPDRFDITRPVPQPPRHLSFAPGSPHHCAGAALARNELLVSLEALTQRLPGLELSVPEVAIKPVLTARGPTALHVRW